MYIYTYMYTHISIMSHMYVYIWSIHLYIYIYIHTYIYIYICTYIIFLRPFGAPELFNPTGHAADPGFTPRALNFGVSCQLINRPRAKSCHALSNKHGLTRRLEVWNVNPVPKNGSWSTQAWSLECQGMTSVFVKLSSVNPALKKQLEPGCELCPGMKLERPGIKHCAQNDHDKQPRA